MADDITTQVREVEPLGSLNKTVSRSTTWSTHMSNRIIASHPRPDVGPDLRGIPGGTGFTHHRGALHAQECCGDRGRATKAARRLRPSLPLLASRTLLARLTWARRMHATSVWVKGYK